MTEKDNTKPNPEVPAQARRRTFTAAFKLKMLREVEARQEAGQEIGSVLRREGLYSSAIREWRAARERGELEGLEPQKRGPKPDPDKGTRAENERLRRENERLRKRLEQAELIIEVQKKSLPAAGAGREERLTTAAEAAGGVLPTAAICDALDVSRATFYRRRPAETLMEAEATRSDAEIEARRRLGRRGR
jgi:transposase-like protein